MIALVVVRGIIVGIVVGRIGEHVLGYLRASYLDGVTDIFHFRQALLQNVQLFVYLLAGDANATQETLENCADKVARLIATLSVAGCQIVDALAHQLAREIGNAEYVLARRNESLNLPNTRRRCRWSLFVVALALVRDAVGQRVLQQRPILHCTVPEVLIESHCLDELLYAGGVGPRVLIAVLSLQLEGDALEILYCYSIVFFLILIKKQLLLP